MPRTEIERRDGAASCVLEDGDNDFKKCRGGCCTEKASLSRRVRIRKRTTRPRSIPPLPTWSLGVKFAMNTPNDVFEY